MNVAEILYAEILRDGGSYALGFEADDGNQYELFLMTTAFSTERHTTHEVPVIYWQDCNSGRIVQSLSWKEAQEFIAPLRYSGRRFGELVKIIASGGKEHPK